MIEAISNRPFVAELEDAPVGQVGQLSLRIEDSDGNIVQAASTANITEPIDGWYEARRTAPTTSADAYFRVVWAIASTEADEVLFVRGTQLTPDPPEEQFTEGVFVKNGEGVIEDRSGNVLATSGVRVWPVSERNSIVGQAYDHRGIGGAHLGPILVGKQNRVLVAGERIFNVVSARYWPTLRYTELELRDMRANG